MHAEQQYLHIKTGRQGILLKMLALTKTFSVGFVPSKKQGKLENKTHSILRDTKLRPSRIKREKNLANVEEKNIFS